MSDEIVTRIEQQEARIAVLRDALDTLVHVVGLTAIKYPSQLPPLQEAGDLALKALKEDAADAPDNRFRAGMRAAASMLSRGRFVTDKAWRDQYADILAEADK